MKVKKLFSIMFILVSVILLGFPASKMAFSNGTIGNEHIQALIDSEGRFNLGVKELSGDRWYNIMYAWPSDPWSSFTTVKVDGVDKIFGNYYDGEFITSPQNVDELTNSATWKTGDVSVKQVLQATLNPATGLPDAIQIRYTLTNVGTVNHDVGLRMMLDTMVNGNDRAPFKVPTENGVESINYGRDFIGEEVPDFWQAFQSFDNPDISAQYTMGGSNATKPDRFSIAHWGSIYGTHWDFTNNSNGTGDSAVGMWWNPVTLAPGETKTITTYYGRPGVGGEQRLVLSGKQSLPHSEWSTSPMNLIAYLTNNTGEVLNNIELRLTTSDGINIVNNDSTHVVDTLFSGTTTQTTWQIQPTRAGTHTVTVDVYHEGSTELYATANYVIEAFEPVVPPNVSLGGDRGTQEDGTPIAGRTSPLTVNASFDNPQATSVTLVATDGNGDRYEHEMDSQNGTDWSHTFTPSSVGLWEGPMTIQVIPTFADGSTGTPQEFEIVLIDPSGIVYNLAEGDETVWPLPDATVVLQYFDPELRAWVNMTNEAYPGMLDPVTNPQITGDDGRYAWDVAAGDYRVIVSRSGFETTISRHVTVPPPVLDLHVGLNPTDFIAPNIQVNGVEDGQSYTDPVTVELSASDDVSGVRFISFQLDGGEEVMIDGDTADITLDFEGEYILNYKVVDHAGNETTGMISFAIAGEEPVEDDILTVLGNALTKNNEVQVAINNAVAQIDGEESLEVINTTINNAIAANNEALVSITRARELLQGTGISAIQIMMMDMQLAMAEQQNNLVSTSLNAALNGTETKTNLAAALDASNKSTASLRYVAGNLVLLLP